MTGSISAVSSASGLRAESRRLRPAMVSALDMSGLLSVSGQGEENVVQGGVAHGESRDQAPARVGRIQQRAHLGGAAVGRHAYRQARRVQVHRLIAEITPDLGEGGCGRAR